MTPQTTPQAEKTYSSRQVCWKTGATLRQLQWWDESRVLKPRMVRHCRRYTARDVVLVRAVLRLKQAHLPRVLMRVVAKRLAPVTTPWALVFLDGKVKPCVGEQQDMRSVLAEATRFALLINLRTEGL